VIEGTEMFLGQAALQSSAGRASPHRRRSCAGCWKRGYESRAGGYRGTGKSVIARRLGRMLNRPVVSLDAEIVRLAGNPFLL